MSPPSENDRRRLALAEKVLLIVDEDIAEAFRPIGYDCYPNELPLQMQIARYLKLLCDRLDRTN